MNKPTTVTVQDPAHLIRLISDATLDISTLQLCTDDILEAVYTSVHENAVKGSKTNIFVGAFTTCHARLKLYESLDVLQKQVLYYDTDSAVYKWRPGQPSIAIGNFLGDMTDELDGDVITEFVSGGAKKRRQSGLQSTRFHAESPRIRHLTFLNHERQYFIGIRHSTGLSLHHEHCHTPLFLKRFRKEVDSSGSVRQAVLDWCLISAWWRRPPVRVIPMVTRGLGTKSTPCWICK